MSEDGFIHEVTEELKREKLAASWRKYGSLFISVAIGLILIVSLYQAYSYYTAKQSAKLGDALIEALNLTETNKIEALKKLNDLELNKSNLSYNYLASFRRASILQSQNKLTDAVKIYDSLIANNKMPKWLQNTAITEKAYSLAETSNVESLKKILAPCLTNNNNFQPTAYEILGLASLKNKDLTNAKKYFNLIIDNKLSSRALTRRAAMMLWVIETEINNSAK